MTRFHVRPPRRPPFLTCVLVVTTTFFITVKFSLLALEPCLLSPSSAPAAAPASASATPPVTPCRSEQVRQSLTSRRHQDSSWSSQTSPALFSCLSNHCFCCYVSWKSARGVSSEHILGKPVLCASWPDLQFEDFHACSFKQTETFNRTGFHTAEL